MSKDSTPKIRFDLAPQYDELLSLVDPEQDARVERELFLLTLEQLHRMTALNRELQEQLHAAIDALRESRRPTRLAV